MLASWESREMKILYSAHSQLQWYSQGILGRVETLEVGIKSQKCKFRYRRYKNKQLHLQKQLQALQTSFDQLIKLKSKDSE